MSPVSSLSPQAEIPVEIPWKATSEILNIYRKHCLILHIESFIKMYVFQINTLGPT